MKKTLDISFNEKQWVRQVHKPKLDTLKKRASASTKIKFVVEKKEVEHNELPKPKEIKFSPNEIRGKND
jgi:hypothetical protein